jgi:hypothetical protein
MCKGIFADINLVCHRFGGSADFRKRVLRSGQGDRLVQEAVLGSILQNSVSAEIFLINILIKNFRKKFHPFTT